jgi:hypothetical protein
MLPYDTTMQSTLYLAIKRHVGEDYSNFHDSFIVFYAVLIDVEIDEHTEDITALMFWQWWKHHDRRDPMANWELFEKLVDLKLVEKIVAAYNDTRVVLPAPDPVLKKERNPDGSPFPKSGKKPTKEKSSNQPESV